MDTNNDVISLASAMDHKKVFQNMTYYYKSPDDLFAGKVIFNVTSGEMISLTNPETFVILVKAPISRWSFSQLYGELYLQEDISVKISTSNLSDISPVAEFNETIGEIERLESITVSQLAVFLQRAIAAGRADCMIYLETVVDGSSSYFSVRNAYHWTPDALDTDHVHLVADEMVAGG
jgi:hypothetical protein